jgi:hypothetical protein
LRERAEFRKERSMEIQRAVAAERELKNMEREADRLGMHCHIARVREYTGTARLRWHRRCDWSEDVLETARAV